MGLHLLSLAPAVRRLVRMLKTIDPAHRSFLTLERRQYRGPTLVVAISEMVRRHFQEYFDLPPGNLRLVRLATDPARLDEALRQLASVDSTDQGN